MSMGALTLNVGYSESRDENNRSSEEVNKAIKYRFADGKKRRFLIVAYEHVIKCVANTKKAIYRRDNPSSRIEEAKYHMMLSFLKNYIIFLIPAY